jgi:ribosomal protein S18 acetylase RimI-like enzyme
VEQVKNKITRYNQQDYKIYVLEKDERVVGFISLHCYEAFHSPGKVGRITAFCIHEQFQGMGLGKQLLAEGEKYFIASGYLKLEVTSNNRRTQAHDFYLAQGYIEDSRKFVKTLLKV